MATIKKRARIAKTIEVANKLLRENDIICYLSPHLPRGVCDYGIRISGCDALEARRAGYLLQEKLHLTFVQAAGFACAWF